MKYLGALCALLVSVSFASAQSITLPPTVNVPKPGLITITPTQVIGDSVRWVAVDDGLQLIPASLLKDSRVAVGVVLLPGSYRVRAIVGTVIGGKAVLSEPVETTVIVGNSPNPIPPQPQPDDPLVQSFQAAYLKDTDSQKATNIGLLAETLGNIVSVARSSGNITQVSQLEVTVKKACDLAIGSSSLHALREAVATYLDTKLPTKDAPITESNWATAATEYAKVAVALKQVNIQRGK